MNYDEYEKEKRYKHVAKIDELLYFGLSFVTNPKTLMELGIKYVFNIGFKIKEFVNNIEYEYIELDDNSQSVNKMMQYGFEIKKKINNLPGEKLICCSMGKSRSVSMILIILKDKYSTFEEAMNKIELVRRVNINPGFKRVLMDFYKN
jgi:protein-tyrosine phosphatase